MDHASSQHSCNMSKLNDKLRWLPFQVLYDSSHIGQHPKCGQAAVPLNPESVSDSV